MWKQCRSFPDLFFSVTEKLGEGFLVLGTKHAQLVNSVLKKEKVCIFRRTHIRTDALVFE